MSAVDVLAKFRPATSNTPPRVFPAVAGTKKPHQKALQDAPPLKTRNSTSQAPTTQWAGSAIGNNRPADVGIQADVQNFLTELNQVLADRRRLEETIRRAKRRDKAAVIHVDVDRVEHMWAPNLQDFKEMHQEPSG